MINGLIVSCQAIEGEILHDYNIMDLMALAAEAGGAKGIRANGARDIKAIKARVDLPVIGLVKAHYGDCNVFITPTLKEVKELCEAGVDCLAMDATFRKRPNGEKLEDLVAFVRKNYPKIELFADTARVEEAIEAEKLGFDYVSTTLCSYTEDTKGIKIPNLDVIDEYVSKIKKSKIVVEGGIWEVGQLKAILAHGIDTVVIGTAITRPMDITKRFAACFGDEKK